LALARDPLLRATTSAVIRTPYGHEFARQSMKDALTDAVGDRLNEATLDKVVRNASSSWTQSGHFRGRGRKTRQRVEATPAATTFALLLGFVAVTAALGGGRPAQALAALLLLLPPALNELRAAVGAERGYWACYLWSVAYLLHWVAAPRGGRAPMGWLGGLAGLALALEMLIFLSIVPLWLWVRNRAGHPHGLAQRLTPLAVGATMLALYTAWRQVLQDGAAPIEVLKQPFDHLAEGWRMLGRGLDFKLEALRGGFLDYFSSNYDQAALLAVVIWIALAGLIKALGLVHAILAAYTAGVVERLLPAPVYRAWRLLLVVSLLLLPLHAVTAFTVAAGQAMVAALTLLAVVPLILERWWHNWLDRVVGYRWILPVVLFLLLIAGLKSLVPRTQEQHLRQAGVWLAETAAPDSSLYSNSRIVAFYSGLDKEPDRAYSWRQAMNTVQRRRWRDYDYLAIAIPDAKSHREQVLMRWIDAPPVRIFNEPGAGRVLIFSGDQ